MNGKRPVFADDIASVFFFPMIHIRFIEIPPAAMAGGGDTGPADARSRSPTAQPAGAGRPRTSRTSRSTRTSCAGSAKPDAPRGRISGPCRTRCYTPGRAQEPRHRRIPREGPDHRALPRRRLPGPRVLWPRPRPAREPRQGQVRRGRRPRLRARVRHLRRPAQAGRRHLEGRQVGRRGLPRHRPRPRGRGDRLARGRGRQHPPRAHPAGDVHRDHRAGRSARRSPTRATSTRTSSTPSRPAGSSTASSATRSARSSRKKVQRGLSAGRVQSVAVRLVVEREREINGLHGARVLDDPGDPRDGGRRDVPGRARPHRRRGASTSPTRRPSDAPRRGDPRAATRSSPSSGRGRRSDRRPPPFTTSTLQQEASRRLGFSPKRTMSVAQRLYEGVETPEGHVGLITYMRTDSTAIAGVAMGEARDVIGERYGEPYTMPKGRVYKTKSKGAQEAHESIRPTSFRRDPDTHGRLPASRTRLRLYRLIWQRALASQMAPKELETTTIELADGPYELRAIGDQGAVRRLLRSSTPRAATTRRPTTRRRPARGCRTSPRAPSRASTTSRRPSTSPSRRRASPRRRSSRRSRSTGSAARRPTPRRSRRSSTAATCGSRSGGSTRSPSPRSSPTSSSSTSATTSTSSSPPGWRRSSTRSPAASGRGCRCCARSTTSSEGRRSTRTPRSRPHDRGDRRGLLARPPDGHPARPERPVPRLLAVSRSTRRRGRCPATSRRPSPGRARSAPSAARARSSARAAASGRSWAARATPSASSSRRTARRRRRRCRSRSSAPRTRTATSCRVARGGPGTSSGGARTTRSCDYTTNDEPLGGLHDADDGAAGPQGRGRALPDLWLDERRGAGRRSCPGERYPGGPANPAAHRPPGSRQARSGQGRGGTSTGRARTGGRTAGPRRHPTHEAGRTRPRRVSGVGSADPALSRFLRSPRGARHLPAHPTVVRDAPSGPTSTGSRSAAWTGEPRPAPTCAPTSRPSRPDTPGRPSPSGSPRSGRSTCGPPARASPRAIRGARSCVRGCPAGCRGSSRPTRSCACWRSSTRSCDAGRRQRRRAIALALRDRALIETAYAAGLRISELAGADSRSSTCARGEVRILGKGRKERIGLLGRAGQARRCGRTWRTGDRCCSSTGAAGDAPARRDLPEPSRRARSASAACATASTGIRRLAGLPAGDHAAHAAPLVRDPPARRRRGPARRPGAARPREPRHDPGLHARLADAPPRGLPRCPPAGRAGSPPRERRADASRRAGLIVSSAFLVSRVLGFVRVVVIGHAFGAVARARRVLRRVPIPGPHLPAGRRRGAVIGAHPDRVRAVHAERGATRLAGRLDGHQPHAHRAGRPRGRPVHPGPGRSSRAITPGFGPAQLDRTIELTRIMLLSPIFLALGAVATSVLNAGGRFTAAAIAPIVYNLAIIGAAVLLGPSMGVEGLAHRRRRSARWPTCWSSSGRCSAWASATSRGSRRTIRRRATPCC